MAGPREGSFYAMLDLLEKGQRVWVESDAQAYRFLQARVSGTARYPKTMQDRRFASAAYTAISAAGIGREPVVLVCITRTK